MCFREPLDLLPLRQTVRPVVDRLALFSLRAELIQWLSKPDKYELRLDGHRLRIYAANPSALAEAQVLITATHGELVTFERPEVHTYYDEDTQCMMEPIMFVRVDVPRAYALALVDDLKCRSANVQEVSLQMHRAVIRAEVPLVHLAGFEQQQNAMTGKAANVSIWLIRYQPGAGTKTLH